MTLPTYVMQQACTQSGYDYLEELEFIQAFTCTYAADIGFFAAGLIAWSAISLAIYTKQGSPIIPIILLFQFGGVVIAQSAHVLTPAIVVLIVAVPPGLGAVLYYRYSR